MTDDFEGINRIQEVLARKAAAAQPERIIQAQEKGAAFLSDQLRGRSSTRRSGAMLASFASKPDATKVETVFGWGKFYGRLVESGHKAGGYARKKKASVSRVKASPHLKPTFDANKDQIYQIMINDLERSM